LPYTLNTRVNIGAAAQNILYSRGNPYVILALEMHLTHRRTSKTMPQENMSSKIGKSSSPSIQRVIENSKNVQQPLGSVKSAISQSFQKKPFKK
jgi:hypothetical protein